jgi:hypothetical protein
MVKCMDELMGIQGFSVDDLLSTDDELEAEDGEVPFGSVLKQRAKRRIPFDLTRSMHTLLRLLDRPPSREECFKLLSDAGGWSSCSLIMWLANKEPIREMYISTFRVGEKEILRLEALRERGLIGSIEFVLSGLVEWDDSRVSKKYDYYAMIKAVCDRNGWTYRSLHNHSKVILARTDQNWFVCETSSNLNENPKIEQFSLENDQLLFEFYQRNLFSKEES